MRWDLSSDSRIMTQQRKIARILHVLVIINDISNLDVSLSCLISNYHHENNLSLVFAGLVFAETGTWKEQRKTSLEILRNMGMGKNQLAEKIQEEVTFFMEVSVIFLNTFDHFDHKLEIEKVVIFLYVQCIWVI